MRLQGRSDSRPETTMKPDAPLTKVIAVLLPIAVVYALFTRSDVCRPSDQISDETPMEVAHQASISLGC